MRSVIDLAALGERTGIDCDVIRPTVARAAHRSPAPRRVMTR
jgi:hypothetical protein